MNVVQIAGRLGKDAESRFTPSGLKVTTLTIAVNVRKAGKEDTMWWRVTIWGDRFDKMLTYLKKGSAVIVIGEMQKPEIWTDKEGRPQVSLDLTADVIKFNPFGGSGTQEGATGTTGQTQKSNYSNDMGDFGGGMTSGSSQYSQSNQTEEPLPF